MFSFSYDDVTGIDVVLTGATDNWTLSTELMRGKPKLVPCDDIELKALQKMQHIEEGKAVPKDADDDESDSDGKTDDELDEAEKYLVEEGIKDAEI